MYTEIVCPMCLSKQVLLIAHDAHEVGCSACAKMIPLTKLVEEAVKEEVREEANKKLVEEQKKLSEEMAVEAVKELGKSKKRSRK